LFGFRMSEVLWEVEGEGDVRGEMTPFFSKYTSGCQIRDSIGITSRPDFEGELCERRTGTIPEITPLKLSTEFIAVSIDELLNWNLVLQNAVPKTLIFCSFIDGLAFQFAFLLPASREVYWKPVSIRSIELDNNTTFLTFLFQGAIIFYRPLDE
jgi:hypothetical protein